MSDTKSGSQESMLDGYARYNSRVFTLLAKTLNKPIDMVLSDFGVDKTYLGVITIKGKDRTYKIFPVDYTASDPEPRNTLVDLFAKIPATDGRKVIEFISKTQKSIGAFYGTLMQQYPDVLTRYANEYRAAGGDPAALGGIKIDKTLTKLFFDIGAAYTMLQYEESNK
jgi:hypothetical protein